MYAQIRKYDSIRGGRTAEQICNDIERKGVALFEQIPGFVDYYTLELNDGGILTVSIYEDRSGVEAAKKVSAGCHSGASVFVGQHGTCAATDRGTRRSREL